MGEGLWVENWGSLYVEDPGKGIWTWGVDMCVSWGGGRSLNLE